MTKGICGLSGSGLSPSEDLQRSLESKLRARLDVNGSLEYALTWKHWDMPSGPPICALRARARRISDNAYTGWPTPTTPSGGRTAPPGTTLTGKMPNGKKRQVTLENVVRATVSGWATPAAQEAGGTPEAFLACKRKARARGHSLGVSLTSLRMQALLSMAEIPGQTLDLFTAGIASTGGLNPEHSRWLMGFPAGWGSCAPTATRSSRKSRRSS